MTFPSDRTEWLGLIVLLLTLAFVAVLLWEILVVEKLSYKPE